MGSVTIGYRYFMGLHFGLCYGPVDALLELKAGDRTAWAGSQTASGSVTVNAPNLFGGEEREGGVAGTLDIMMGEATQAANSYLTAKQGGAQPAYRGLLTAVFRGIPSSALGSFPGLRSVVQSGGYIGSMNPYIKPWAFKVRRIAQGWRTPVFYAAKAAITVGSVQAMNPAHIIYQCLTDPEWGMGYPASAIDTAAFTAAADKLHTESFGLCMQWARTTTIEDFIQIVCNHIGAVVTTDRRTGLFVLTLIRGGYTVSSLPLFDESNIVSLDSYQRSAPAESTNEITVKFRDPTTNKDTSVTVQNLASINAQGGVVSRSVSYTGLVNRDMAARVAQRDLLAATANLVKVRFRANRQAHSLLPGAVIRFSWAKLGVVDIPMRIGRVDYGTLTDGTITIEAVEDVFGLPTQTYVGAPPGGWVSPVTDPQPTPAQLTLEAPYRTVFRGSTPSERAAIAATDCYAIGLAARPSNSTSLGYRLQTRVGAAAYTDKDTLGAFAPYGLTTGAVTRTATSINLTAASARDIEQLVVGSAAILGGTEIVCVTSVDPDTLTIGIARGCADTVPQSHSSGAVFWGLDDWDSNDTTIYAQSELVDGRYVTYSGGGLLAEGSANVSTFTMARRYDRPYPPGRLRVNGATYPASIAGALTINWAHRDRVLQQDQLIDSENTSIGPESGTTYTVELYDQANVLRRTVTGLTGTTYTWSTEEADSPNTAGGANAMLRFEGRSGTTTHHDESIAGPWTNNGGAALSSAQTFFGLASLLLNGSSQWLSRSSGFGFGTADFTLTLRCRPSVNGVNMVLFDCRATQPSAGGFALYRDSAGNLQISSNNATQFGSSGALPINTWSLVRISRQGANLRAFINGTLVATWSSATASMNDNVAVIGRANPEANQYWNGHIQDFQVVLRAALSTATHTPSIYRAAGRFGYIDARDFSGASAAGQTLFGPGTQSAATNALVLSGSYAMSRIEAAPTINGAIEADITIPASGGYAGIAYRTTSWQASDSTYGWLVYFQSNVSNALRIGYGSNSAVASFTIVNSVTYTATPGATVRLRVEFVGQQHRVYVDGVLLMTATSSVYETTVGMAGLYHASTGSSTFDNLVLYSGAFERVFERDWTDGLTTGQTLFRGGTASQSVVSGRYRHTITAQGDSRFDALQAAQLPIADGAFEIDFVVPASGLLGGITYRSPSLATEWRYLAYASSSSGYVIGRQVSGAFVLLATDTTANPAPGSTVRLRIEVQENTHRLYANGVLRVTATDSNTTAAGDVGILSGNASASIDYDNFVAYRALPGGLNNPVRFRLFSVRGGQNSLQAHDMTIPRG